MLSKLFCHVKCMPADIEERMNDALSGKCLRSLPCSAVSVQCHKTQRYLEWMIPLALAGVCLLGAILLDGWGARHLRLELTASMPCLSCLCSTVRRHVSSDTPTAVILV